MTDADTWVCSTCTLVNPQRATRCEACGNRKPSQPQPLSSSSLFGGGANFGLFDGMFDGFPQGSSTSSSFFSSTSSGSSSGGSGMRRMVQTSTTRTVNGVTETTQSVRDDRGERVKVQRQLGDRKQIVETHTDASGRVQKRKKIVRNVTQQDDGVHVEEDDDDDEANAAFEREWQIHGQDDQKTLDAIEPAAPLIEDVTAANDDDDTVGDSAVTVSEPTMVEDADDEDDTLVDDTIMEDDGAAAIAGARIEILDDEIPAQQQQQQQSSSVDAEKKGPKIEES